MKKTLFFLSICFSITFNYSQEIANQTIGLRLGDANGLGAEVSYQRAIFDTNRIEVGLAWRSISDYNAIKLTGTYQWIFELNDDFNWYVGAGGGLGSWNEDDDDSDDDGFFLLAAGDIGIEYKFDFPLLVSLDFRPELGFANFNNDLGLDIALGLRYTLD